MNCPHCQKELPENQTSLLCPFCGQGLASQIDFLDKSTPVKFQWPIFLCALLMPPVLTLLSAALHQSPNDNVSPMLGMVAGIIGGIICGVMLGFKSSRNIFVRISLSIVMSAIMVVVCIVLCCFGCTAGGYKLEM